jgi:hypothetical protein
MTLYQYRALQVPFRSECNHVSPHPAAGKDASNTSRSSMENKKEEERAHWKYFKIGG